MKKLLIISSCLAMVLCSYGFNRPHNQHRTENTDTNPRGEERPHNGRGQGNGNGGHRDGTNQGPCNDDGPGYGQGQGQGSGQNRTK